MEQLGFLGPDRPQVSTVFLDRRRRGQGVYAKRRVNLDCFEPVGRLGAYAAVWVDVGCASSTGLTMDVLAQQG